MGEYKLRKRSDVCMISGRPFQPGETVVSAIYEDPEEGFVRRDVSEEAFQDGGQAYSFWRTKHPEPVEDQKKLDYDLALAFLQRLLQDADPSQEALVYVLTLLLSRKRRVKIRGSRALPEGDLLTVAIPGPEEDETIQVRAPRLTAEDVDRLQAELAKLFDFAAPAQDSGGDEPAA